MTRHGSTRAGTSFPRSPQRSPARSPGRRFSNPREPQNLSRPGRLPSRPSTGNIHSIRENRKAKPTKSANREAHRNWGSLCSDMGSMRWDDSIKSVSEFFDRSKNGPDAANRPRPPMSIMGNGRRGPRKNNRDILTSSLRNFANVAEVLTAANREAQMKRDGVRESPQTPTPFPSYGPNPKLRNRGYLWTSPRTKV